MSFTGRLFMDQAQSKIKIYGALAAGLLSFGFAPILVRLAPGTPPLVLVSYRTVAAALVLYPYWRAKRSVGSARASTKENLLIALAGICLGLHFACWLSSLYFTSVASASVLVTIHPILVILAERLLFKKSFAGTTWLGVILAFAGAVLLGYFDQHISEAFANPIWGNFLALSAAVLFVAYLFLGQKVRQSRSWIDYVFPVYAYAAITCLILVLLLGANIFQTSIVGILAGLGLAFGPQILGHGSMNYAVKFISPTYLSTLILVEPLLASTLAFFFFDEIPPAASLFAMIIVLAGIGLTWKRTASQN